MAIGPISPGELLVPRPNGSAKASSRKRPGKNVLVREAIDQKLDGLRAELEGPNPTPIERLLAERASLCWFIVHWYENAYVNASGWNISQADLQHRKIDKAHARFLSALRTLAQVRKLAVADPPSEHRQESSQRGGDPVVSEPETGLSPSRLRAVNVLAGAESDGADVAGCESEAVAEWLRR